MMPFEKKWACYSVPMKAAEPNGYDVIMASGMLGHIAPTKVDESQRGIKNSADKRIMMSIFKREILPLLNSEIPIIMPIAEPPQATKSITEIELSCIINTFIVAFLESFTITFINSFN